MLNNKVKVVIPARYASSRLKAKPLLEINNKPLFWHVAQRAQEAGVDLSNIIIATDHNKIASAANRLNLPVVMTAIEHVSGTERANEVANKLNWSDDTFVINVQGDEPLIPPHLIKRLITFTKLNLHFSITTAVTSIDNYADFVNINVVKAVINECNQALYFTRSPAPLNRDNPQDLTAAKRHIGIYMYNVNVLKIICSSPESELERIEKLEQLRALSNGLTIGAMDYIGDIPHGVDTEREYLIIKALME